MTSLPSMKELSSAEMDNLHPLLGKWDLYYHLPSDKNWDLSSYKTMPIHITTAEIVAAIHCNITEYVVKNTMLFVMREKINPQWEDPQNRDGGCFSFKVPQKNVYQVWKDLFCALCGETLLLSKNHPEINSTVNGITISPKRGFHIIKIWLKSCQYQDPSIITAIPNLSIQGCIFKKHEAEF